MSDDNTSNNERRPVLIADHRIVVLIVITIAIALISTSFGLMLYNASGTAQLDLSRPSYEGVGEIVEQNKETYVEYSASGEINEESLLEFRELYQAQREGLMMFDAFGGDPLSPEMLGINED